MVRTAGRPAEPAAAGDAGTPPACRGREGEGLMVTGKRAKYKDHGSAGEAGTGVFTADEKTGES